MFYLKDSDGKVVRAVNWSSENLTVIQRHDTKRVELTEDLSYFDQQNIEYTVLDIVNKSDFAKTQLHSFKELKGHLTLVCEVDQVLENVELPTDDVERLKLISKRTTQVSAGVAVLIFGLTLFIQNKSKSPEIEVVQVMDRKQIEQYIVPPAPVRVVVPMNRTQPKVVKASMKPVLRKNKATAQSSGVLGVLGSLEKSRQRGGLNLDNAKASAGIGRGGTQGSGGVQTAVYSKGMFSAPLGTGGNAQGAGGYGTRGKGGGKAGYGTISLVGSGSSFFQPVESEAFFGGGLDRNAIAAVINRHLSEVRFCYEEGLQNKPKLAGRLSMDFLIGPNGIVTSAKVGNSSLNHARVEGCIRDRLKTWNFPKPVGGVTVKVSYPFILRRVSDT